ncbi:MAG: sel1 repeat family protein [Deltaproteobacteria bacterium]|jgi:TPR repeat protein|nr:sel1 repeat family protein [Deltaproteobacteria bacterium]
MGSLRFIKNYLSESVNPFLNSFFENNAYGDIFDHTKQAADLYESTLASINQKNFKNNDWPSIVSSITKAANLNHPEAQNALGNLYHTGFLVPLDIPAAVSWYQKAAMQGNALAQLELFFLLNYDDNGIPKDEIAAKKWLKAFFAQKHPNAQMNRDFFILDDGYFLKKRSIAYKQKPEDLPPISSHPGISSHPSIILYRSGTLELENGPELDFNVCKKLAELGDADNQYKYGVYFLKGEFVPKNNTTAIQWIQKAAEHGQILAQFALSRMDFLDKDEHNNLTLTAESLRKAADRNIPEAQTTLALFLSQDLSVPQNRKEAFILLQKAANQGFPHAQFYLAKAYLNGTLCPKNFRLGLSWLVKAADQRMEQAIEELLRLNTDFRKLDN